MHLRFIDPGRGTLSKDLHFYVVLRISSLNGETKQVDCIGMYSGGSISFELKALTDRRISDSEWHALMVLNHRQLYD
jgi:hypothetical protein